MREVAYFQFDFLCKTGPINAIPTPSWDDRLVTDFMVKFDYDKKVARAANSLC